MKRKNQNWSVERLNKHRDSISFPEYQREKSLWPVEKKSLLIDSILHDIDIPKLYFNQISENNYEVIDGQQRLWAIWEYLQGRFPYKSQDKSGKPKRFKQLSPDQQNQISNYPLQITVFQEATDEYLRQLFVRLQLGLLVNTGEKLNAAKGRMKDLVFKSLAKHSFIKQIGIPKRRFAKETLCAQICINSFARERWNGKFSRTRYEDLIHFFDEFADPRGIDFQLFKNQSDKIKCVLDRLHMIFGGNSKNLKNRSFVLSIFFFVEQILNSEGDLSKDESKLIADFIFKLWKRLREETKLGMDRQNRELYSFQTMLNSAPGEAYQIERRQNKLNEYYGHYIEYRKISGDP